MTKIAIGLVLITALFFLPKLVFARVTPNDIYQQKEADFKNSLSLISDSTKKQQVEQANQMIIDLNQSICASFDLDINKMAAILDEEKQRQQVNKTVVAYGQGSTPLDQAEYYLNYAEEALAYQKAQYYIPQISGGNLSGSLTASTNSLFSDLTGVQGKVLKAKTEISIALDYYEK